jgi:hypothetical protein
VSDSVSSRKVTVFQPLLQGTGRRVIGFLLPGRVVLSLWALGLILGVAMCTPLPLLAAPPPPETILVHVEVSCPGVPRGAVDDFLYTVEITAMGKENTSHVADFIGGSDFSIESVQPSTYTVQIQHLGRLENLAPDWEIPEAQTVEVKEEEPGPEIEFILPCKGPGGAATPLPQADAPPPGLTMEPEAHFDGHFKYGEWLPVRITLENTGPALEGQVQVTVRGSGGSNTYGVPALLPQTSKKQLTLYVLPNSYSRELSVNLVANEEVLIDREVKVQPLANIDYLIGVVASNPDPLSSLTGLAFEGREETEVVSFPLDQLPGRVEALRSFDCLVINNVNTSALASDQREALAHWVNLGGRLVIGGGPGAQRTLAGLPAELSAGGIQDTVEVSTLSALDTFLDGGASIRVPGPFVAAPVSAEGAVPLVMEGDVPLVVESAVGRGFVDYVALDLTLSPFDAWAGTRDFWKKLLQPGAAYPDYLPPDVSPRQRAAQQMISALQNVPAMDFPSVKWLAGLLAIYVVLVGPTNYLLLRRLNHLEWAWLTIPALTIIFSAGAFGIGYTMRGNELILNKISVIQKGSGSPVTIVRSYVGLFSPTRRAYDIKVGGSALSPSAGGTLVSPATPDYSPWAAMGGSSSSGSMTVLQGEPTLIKDLDVNQWSMQTFMAESVTAEPLTIEAKLETEEGHVVGTVVNETNRPLKDCVIVAGRSYALLGDVETGEGKDVDIDLAEPKVGRPEELPWRIMETRISGVDLVTGSPEHRRQTELKRAVLGSVFDPYGGGSLRGDTLSSSDVIFFGWLDESPPDVLIENHTLSTQEISLLVTDLPLSFGEARVSIPAGIYSTEVVESSGEFGPCDPMSTSFHLGAGSATVSLQPPAELSELSVEKVSLVLGNVDDGGWWGDLEASLYDWETEEWAPAEDVSMGRNEVEDPGRFVEATTGTIRVKLTSSGDMGGCVTVGVEVEGEK